MLPVRQLLCAAISLALAACATAPVTPPASKLQMPPAWNEPAPAEAVPLAQDWWQAFGSQELAGLVAQALAESPTLAIATERIRQAEAQARIAGASLFPKLDLVVDAAHEETRESGLPPVKTDSTIVALNASYELDLWGKNRSGSRSADALLGASRFDRETAALTLRAGVATAYFQVLSLRARLAIARENLAVAERVLGVVDARFRNGAANALDVARQRAALFTQRAAIPPLELQERQTLVALAVLIGQAPEDFGVTATDVAGLAVPAVMPGLPAELLVRRPDIASAEAQLAAANANVAAARAALLPSISLTGTAGLASTALLSLTGEPSRLLSIAATLLQPIFDGGRLRGQVDLSASRERELVETYRAAILAALADVENALVAANRSLDQERLQENLREEAGNALRLAELRYREGADDLLVVLDAQRTLSQAEDQLAQIRLSRLQASVALYRALGGGWTATEPPVSSRSAERISGAEFSHRNPDRARLAWFNPFSRLYRALGGGWSGGPLPRVMERLHMIPVDDDDGEDDMCFDIDCIV